MKEDQTFGTDEYSLPAAFADHDSIMMDSTVRCLQVHNELKQSGNLITASVKEFSFSSGQLMR